MKEETINQKSKTENISHSSPSLEKESSVNLSPPMNQKYFPSKENFFGKKTSKADISPSPSSQSPILNYYATTVSPENQDYYYSNNNNNSNKLSPNFNYSPSVIFNQPNNIKDLSLLQNFSLQNTGNNEEDSKTLQEKMDPFFRTDANHFMKEGSAQSNLQDNKKNKEEEDEDDDEQIFTLTIDNDEEDSLGFNKLKNNPINEKIQNKNYSIFKEKINNNANINASNNSIINSNNIIANDNANNNKIKNNPNTKINDINTINDETKNSMNKKDNMKEKNEKKDTNDIKIINEEKQKESLLQTIFNKNEFKPYIPNSRRIQPNEINNSQNFVNDFNFNIDPKKNLVNEMNNLNLTLGIMENENPGIFIFNNNINNLNNINNINNNMNNNFNQNYIPNNMNINNNYYNIPQISDNNCFQDNNLYKYFHYNGDNYQISNFKEYKRNLKGGEIPSISAADIVTTITANNKKIKRIDPHTYLNESIEYLSYNIFPLAKDQAGCRFLQEKLIQEPKKASEAFYNAIIPFILPLVKDAFGNYLIQKLCTFLSPDKIKKILEIIAPSILDVGSNSHGTRVIQHLVSCLTTKELSDYFMSIIKPDVILLLKELNGTHIINKFVNEHPEYANEINKIIIENCSTLASHRHGCCILQKLVEGPNKTLKYNLIKKLIDNIFVLIGDQYGNYVIQSILLLHENEASSAVASKICDNLPIYSKHKYSSNVIEKCFDFCEQKDRNKLIEKLSSPDIVADLILDEHGNYVIQKALFFAESDKKEIILNTIAKIIPKIKTVSFGEKLLNRLFAHYPTLSSRLYKNNDEILKNAIKNSKKNKKKGKKGKNKNDNNINNKEKHINNDLLIGNNNGYMNNNNSSLNNNNNNINVNNNITINNFNNFNNNQMNLNFMPNANCYNRMNFMNFNNMINNNELNYNQNFIPENNININENKKKKKKKNKKNKKNENCENDLNNNIYNNNIYSNSSTMSMTNKDDMSYNNNINQKNLNNFEKFEFHQ